MEAAVSNRKCSRVFGCAGKRSLSRTKEEEKWQHEERAWAKDIAGAREGGLEPVVKEITSAVTQSSREVDD